MKFISKISCIVLVTMISGCFSIKYGSKIVTIPPEIETFSVQFFPNRARLVEPTFSQEFTDALKQYVENNTRLRLVNGMGHVDFSGTITGYNISPQQIARSGEGQSKAAMTRFNITVKVSYTNNQFPDEDWEKSFSRFRDFESASNFKDVEEELREEILEELMDDIYNVAFANW